MGIEPSSINVRDLEISRPSRTGPGGDPVGDPTVLGTALSGSYTIRNRSFRTSTGREAVQFATIFVDPILDAAGAIVPVLAGDWVRYTDPQGVESRRQEIVEVLPTSDCEGRTEILELMLGRTSSVEV